MMALDLFRLLVFVTVVDRNGYSAAARYLHLGQPTVSHHISELQRLLGTELLRYAQGTIHVTAAGREVYRSAVLMLGEQDSLTDTLRDIKGGRRGRMRLGASFAFEQKYFMDQVIAPYCHSHTGTFLSLRFGHSTRHAQAVLDRELDLAYVIRWQIPAEVDFEFLHKAALTFLAPSDHPLATHGAVTVEQIAEFGLITAPLSSMESTFYRQVFREGGLTGDHSVFEVEGMQARVFAAQAGLGIMATFIPRYSGSRVMQPLVPLELKHPPTEVDIGLVRRKDETESESLDDFADWIRQVTRAE